MFDDSGTLVVWSDLDRVEWKQASTTFKHTELLIGRIYRRFLAHLYHALNKHSYFQWVTTFERCVWHYRRLLGDYTMVFWMPPGSGSTLKAS